MYAVPITSRRRGDRQWNAITSPFPTSSRSTYRRLRMLGVSPFEARSMVWEAAFEGMTLMTFEPGTSS